MADSKYEEKVEEVLKEMKEERGYLPAQWEYVAREDVDYIEAYNHLHRVATQDGKALPEKYKQLAFMAVLAFRGLDGPLYEHMKRALRCGATKREIFEAFEALVICGGAPTMGAGMKALARIAEEEKKAK
jgi:alkylhydroperoxidase/carboxymuconolactone decarboxylase family protein YurZ